MLLNACFSWTPRHQASLLLLPAQMGMTTIAYAIPWAQPWLQVQVNCILGTFAGNWSTLCAFPLPPPLCPAVCPRSFLPPALLAVSLHAPLRAPGFISGSCWAHRGHGGCSSFLAGISLPSVDSCLSYQGSLCVIDMPMVAGTHSQIQSQDKWAMGRGCATRAHWAVRLGAVGALP